MPATSDAVLALIKNRPDTIPEGYADAVVSTYIDEAKAAMLAYCRTLPPNIQQIPDDLLYPWAEIATVLMWDGATAAGGKPSSIKEGDVSVSFTAGKFDGSGLVYSGLDNIRALNRYRSLF